MPEEIKKEGISEKLMAFFRKLFGFMFSAAQKEHLANADKEKRKKQALGKAVLKVMAKRHYSAPKKAVKKAVKSLKMRKEAKAEQADDNSYQKKAIQDRKLALRKEKIKEIKNPFGKKKKKQKIEKNKKSASMLPIERVKIFQKDVEKAFSEWELAFPSINLTDEVINSIKHAIYKELMGKDFKKEKIEKRISFAMREAVNSIVQPVPDLAKLMQSKPAPLAIILLGADGSGKTLSAAKLGMWLQKKKISCLFAACDTRNSSSSLEEYAKDLNLPITKAEFGAEPNTIASEAARYAKKEGIKCVIIDTSASTDANALADIKKIIRACRPNLKIFVGKSAKDASTLEQASYINKAVGIDGIIITKTDLYDDKGPVLNISHQLKKPICFLGYGPELEDVKVFDKESLLKRLKLG